MKERVERLHNHSLPQKTTGIFASGPGMNGDLALSEPIPGRSARNFLEASHQGNFSIIDLVALGIAIIEESER